VTRNRSILLINLRSFWGSVTLATIEVGTDGAITSSRMNFSGYVGRATIS